MNKVLMDSLIADGYEVELLTVDGFDFKLNIFEKIKLKLFGLPVITSKRYHRLKEQYDVVICNGEFSFGVDHKRCINIFHGSYWGYLKATYKFKALKEIVVLLLQSFIQYLGSRKKVTIAVSNFAKSTLEKQQINVFQVINNPKVYEVDRKAQGRTNGKLLYVGSYDYYGKGIDRLVDIAKSGIAIDCITDKQPPSPLGYIPKTSCRTQLKQYYETYDVLIFPSRFEGAGLVAVEALCMGKPIFMANTGIGQDLKKYVPDYVVDFDSGALCEHINSVVRNNGKNYKMVDKYLNDFHCNKRFREQWVSLIDTLMLD